MQSSVAILHPLYVKEIAVPLAMPKCLIYKLIVSFNSMVIGIFCPQGYDFNEFEIKVLLIYYNHSFIGLTMKD